MYQCEICKKSFYHLLYLKRHAKRMHYRPNDINMPFKCSECENKFKSKDTLNKHRRRIHKNVIKQDYVSCQEENCNEKFPNLQAFRDHLKLYHELSNQDSCQELVFGTKEDFNKWLTEEEQKCKCTFVVSCSEKKYNSHSTKKFICSRSGNFKSASKELRQFKGTKKIGYHCTAQIILKMENDKIYMKYFEKHYKHDYFLSYLPINQDMKDPVTDFGMMGIRCNFCPKCFSSTSTFNRHLKHIHNVDPASSRKNIICPNETCGMKFARKHTFLKHLEEVHQIDLEIEKKEFSNYAEFYAWKDNIVRETDCTYSKKAPSRSLVKGEKVEYFNCNRCGCHNPQARRKYASCPSFMNVLITENKVLVKFQKTHYGHSMEIPDLFLTDQEKIAIAYKPVPGEKEESKNIPFLNFWIEEQNLTDIVSDFSDSCSSSDFKLNTSKSLLENVSSSILLESNRKEVALLHEKLNSISSVDKKESTLLEANKQEMTLLSEKLNSISSMDKSLSVQIKYHLNAIEHLIDVQAATTDSELTN